MQIKTINQLIEKKIDEWVQSITDEPLRDRLKKNVLVSGGSIASMLLNIDVNDYDIYIMDRNVLLDLTKYYTSKYDVTVLDGNFKQGYIDDIMVEYAHLEQPFEKLQGRKISAVRTLKDDQIKIYTTDGSGGLRIDHEDDTVKYRPVFFSANAISLSDKVQIVIRFWGSPEVIHSTFDYIHATNYWTQETGLKLNIDAMSSLMTKQLMYQGSQFPITSVIRMRKFLKRNWNINAGEILKMCLQIGELDLKDPDVLEEQIIGVDVAYFSTLIEAMRTVPVEKWSLAYIFEIIDRVFKNSPEHETEQ